MISLSKAIKEDVLHEFIKQQEEVLISIKKSHFDDLAAKLIRAPRPQDRTSDSRVRGGSTGK